MARGESGRGDTLRWLHVERSRILVTKKRKKTTSFDAGCPGDAEGDYSSDARPPGHVALRRLCFRSSKAGADQTGARRRLAMGTGRCLVTAGVRTGMLQLGTV